MARPTKLTPELQGEICTHIRETGMFRRRAAALVNVSEQTFSEWYSRGSREDEGIHHEFFLAINRAEAEFQHTACNMLKIGSTMNSSLLLKWLARRFPEEFGRRDNIVEESIEDRAAQALATRALLFSTLNKLFPKVEELPALPAGEPVKAPDVG
jgi:hypothetical protein